jgi:hypothetical protein
MKPGVFDEREASVYACLSKELLYLSKETILLCYFLYDKKK